jgi:hypothetical protein
MTPPVEDALDALPLPSELPEAEPRASLRVAPDDALEAARRRRRARLIMFGAAAVSAASMFGLVAFHVFAVQSSFQLDKLQKELTSEQRRYGMLRDEVAMRSSPQAVASAAEALHMVRPSQVTVLHVPGAKPLDASNNLPVPAPPDYKSIAAGP